MTKEDLIAQVSETAEITKVVAGKAVDATFKAISGALAGNDKFTYVGFGTFRVVDRSERVGRNPRTGAAITIPAGRVARFQPGTQLRNLVAGTPEPKEEPAEAGARKKKAAAK